MYEQDLDIKTYIIFICQLYLNMREKDMQIANEHIKRCSTFYVIKELQIKTVRQYCYIPIRMTKMQNSNNT